jgi:hypothetical protein
MSSPILNLPHEYGNNFKEGAIIIKIKDGGAAFDRAAIGLTNLEDAMTEYIAYIEMLKTKISNDHGGSRRYRRSRRFNRSVFLRR